MNREEIKDRARKIFNKLTEQEDIAFPILLMDLAQHFFVYGEDIDKELADETRKRLLELKQTGVTS